MRAAWAPAPCVDAVPSGCMGLLTAAALHLLQHHEHLQPLGRLARLWRKALGT